MPPGRYRLAASIGGVRAADEVTVAAGGRADVRVTVGMERRWSAPDASASLLAEAAEVRVEV